MLLLQAARDETLPFGASLLPAKRAATIAYQPCMTTLVGALQPALRSSALLSDDPLIRRVLSINWAGDREEWRVGAIGSRRVSPEIRRDKPRSAEISRDQPRSAEISRDQHPRSAEISRAQLRSAEISRNQVISTEISRDQPRLGPAGTTAACSANYSSSQSAPSTPVRLEPSTHRVT